MTTTRKPSRIRLAAKETATELLILHGFSAFSFNLLAERIQTTSANLHYHFGNKMGLVEEVLADYATDTAARFGAVWLDEDRDFQSKVHGTFLFNKERYDAFNGQDASGRPWSLIYRMRTDQEFLSEAAVAALRRFEASLNDAVRQGVSRCVSRGDLVPDTPVDEVVILMTSIINSAGPISQHGSISVLRDLYNAFYTTITAAYGPQRQPCRPGPVEAGN